MSADDGFLAPPPGLVPAPRKAEDVKPEPAAPQDFISLPPGISAPDLDSGTVRVENPRRARPEREETSAPLFVPTIVPGLPVALPVPAPVDADEPAQADEPADADEATSFAVGRRSAPAWRIALPDGRQLLVERTTLVGRDPSHQNGWPDAVLLPVTDPGKSVSKTHAVLEVDEAGHLALHDLNSTNGSYLAYAGSDEIEVVAGSPQPVEAGAELSLGEYTITVHRT